MSRGSWWVWTTPTEGGKRVYMFWGCGDHIVPFLVIGTYGTRNFVCFRLFNFGAGKRVCVGEVRV